MIPFLETPRLVLRLLEEADVDGAYVDWLNDEQTCLGMRHHAFPFTRQQAIDYIRNLSSDRSMITLAISLKEDMRHVGNITLREIDPVHRSAELGVLLGDKEVRGKGFAVEACHAMLRHAFFTLNLHRINCGTMADNHGMISVARKLGFAQEGVQRQSLFKNGRFVDVVYYGLLAAEYNKVRRPSAGFAENTTQDDA